MDPNDFKKFADIIPEESRNSLFKPSMQNVGVVITGLFLTAFAPIVKYGLVKQNEINKFAKGLDEKLQHIPAEKRTDENKLIALKAFEDSRFQLNNSELSELFESLIASMFNSDYNDKISPVYSSILSQISPKTALVFKEWIVTHSDEVAPLGTIKAKTSSGGSRTIKSGLLVLKNGDFVDDNHEHKTRIKFYDVSVELSELSYLGLITIEENTYLTHEVWQTFYQALADHNKVPVEMFNEKVDEVYLKKGMVSLTELGNRLKTLLFN